MSNEETKPENEPEETPAETVEAPPAEQAETQPPENLSLQEQYDAVKAERDENHERWLRSQAEIENMRRRSIREQEELSRYRALPLARDLLPALDNLQRAIEAARQNPQVEELLQGIEMVTQQFGSIFAGHSIEAIEAIGQEFDPNLHEALQQIPTDEHPPMTVIQEVEKGYKLHDRVIRPAKVIVAAPAEQA